MDSEGYPDHKELWRIRKWDVNDFPALLDFVEDLHCYKDYVKRDWIQDDIFKDRLILKWTFCTGGWSGNESLIHALLKNVMLRMMWYYSWQRGGKYVFHIDPKSVDFKLVSEYCKENKISRQAIYKRKNHYEFLVASPKKVFVRVRKR